jgi:hypothetical protein
MGAEKPNDKTINDIHENKLALEYEQWEYQKDWHKQENEIENKKLKQAKLDTWVRGLVSAILGTAIAVSIPAAITIYGIEIEKEKTSRAQEQRKQETLIQLINSRESADSNLRSQMFSALLQHYFQQRDYRTQIAILEIIGLNFRDALHTKPMFERLHVEIMEKEEKPQELLESLKKASGRIIKDQLQQIRQSKEGGVCEIEFQISPMTKDPIIPVCFQELVINLIDIKDDHIIVRTNSKDGVLLGSKGDTSGDDFKVSFYDMPMIDYTSVVTKAGYIWKYSIVLKEVNKEKNTVKIAIANLPEETYGASEKYKFDEMLKGYLYEN